MTDEPKLIESVFEDLKNWAGFPAFYELFLGNKLSPVYLSGEPLEIK
jgi:hypothetical protein